MCRLNSTGPVTNNNNNNNNNNNAKFEIHTRKTFSGLGGETGGKETNGET